ncbi:hypothetical protein HDV05_007302 [Chytridiales sp. JEL 0842]|nr:hypothetical protein HDV05_007302 [Chytridiales sp. JEL 0842]
MTTTVTFVIKILLTARTHIAPADLQTIQDAPAPKTLQVDGPTSTSPPSSPNSPSPSRGSTESKANPSRVLLSFPKIVNSINETLGSSIPYWIRAIKIVGKGEDERPDGIALLGMRMGVGNVFLLMLGGYAVVNLAFTSTATSRTWSTRGVTAQREVSQKDLNQAIQSGLLLELRFAQEM